MINGCYDNICRQKQSRWRIHKWLIQAGIQADRNAKECKDGGSGICLKRSVDITNVIWLIQNCPVETTGVNQTE